MIFEALKIFPEYIKWMLGKPKEISRTPQFLWKATNIYHYIAILSSCSGRGTHAHKSPSDYLLGSRPEIKQEFIKIFLPKKVFLFPRKYGSHA